MLIKKIFLASSSELATDRKEFEIFINRVNNRWVKKGVFLELVIWENFLDAVSSTRLQDEYNKAIQTCDLFVLLFFTKVGKYTKEEFEVAYNHFKAKGKPLIFTYFKTADINTGDITKDILSLLQFKEDLHVLGHFTSKYKSTSDLLFQFDNQLKELYDAGFFNIVEEASPQKQEIVANKNTKFGEYDVYKCNRQAQRTTFIDFLSNKKEKNNCSHFFYFHGDRKQSHKGLFKNFISILNNDNKEVDSKNEASNLSVNIITKEISFPNIQSEEVCKIELIKNIKQEFQVPVGDWNELSTQRLATIINKSPDIKAAKATDKVCVFISIPHTRWNKNLTPKIATWFVEEFCDQKQEIIGVQAEATGMIKKVAPEFFFFFSIFFSKRDERIRLEIKEALKEATATKKLEELLPVSYKDVEDWFYENFDEEEYDIVDDKLTTYFGEEPLEAKDKEKKQFDMIVVQKKLGTIIKDINNKNEKNELRS